MVEGSEEEIKNNSNNFNLKNELSALVENNVIPESIAKKLEQKLNEKHIAIDKKQLDNLVEKIRIIMQSYSKDSSKNQRVKPTIDQPATTINDKNMKQLMDSIQRLEERLSNLEINKIGTPDKKAETDSIDFTTTDDIKIPVEKWSFDPLKKVYNDPESIVVLMKWLQYLIDKCGRDNLSNILDYYVDVGWISADAKISLIDYSHGIKEQSDFNENKSNKNITNLPSRDHIQSLIYIQKLKGIDVDKHFVERIDNELSRITKKLTNYNIK